MKEAEAGHLQEGGVEVLATIAADETGLLGVPALGLDFSADGIGHPLKFPCQRRCMDARDSRHAIGACPAHEAPEGLGVSFGAILPDAGLGEPRDRYPFLS